MLILPPDLVPDRQRYFADLNYRHECDCEVAAERHERILTLLYPERYIENPAA